MSEKPRNNYTQIPNLIDELELSPLAVALYFHYSRWKSTRRKLPGVRTLSKKYRVSNRAIERAKTELLTNHLIHMDRRAAKGLPDLVIVRDIWERNSKHFNRDKPPPDANGQQVNRPDVNGQQVEVKPDAKEHRDLMLGSNSIERKELKTVFERRQTTNECKQCQGFGYVRKWPDPEKPMKFVDLPCPAGCEIEVQVK